MPDIQTPPTTVTNTKTLIVNKNAPLAIGNCTTYKGKVTPRGVLITDLPSKKNSPMKPAPNDPHKSSTVLNWYPSAAPRRNIASLDKHPALLFDKRRDFTNSSRNNPLGNSMQGKGSFFGPPGLTAKERTEQMFR